MEVKSVIDPEALRDLAKLGEAMEEALNVQRKINKYMRRLGAKPIRLCIIPFKDKIKEDDNFEDD
jgi:hypothetical protein